MSTINNALSELAKKESKVAIEAAEVPKIKTRSPLLWVTAGFSLSLAMGGWAVSQGPSVESGTVELSHAVNDEVTATNVVSSPVLAESPTKKIVSAESQPALEKALAKTAANGKPTTATNTSVGAASEPVKASRANVSVARTTDTPTVITSKPVLLASTQTTNAQPKKSVAQAKPLTAESAATAKENASGIVVEQVDLTPEQLAANAVGRGKKALDANNLEGALQGFTEALRYTPRDEEVRQKLAILYFGKGETRRAYELLQAGIRLNNDSEALRLGLSKLLVKADQAEAALSPLLYLPSNVSKEYLAMRAALSQKAQRETIALESYQKLTEIEQDNARWWLGLAIQQERQLMFEDAKQSYQNALVRVGISSQSQSFIRDRLKVISDLEGTKNAD
ncbi:tetratricopeptide repeat protein [Vibrio pelagius]|uniref:Tetratricopeptide repeat protein n=1 Tax=Vibrio pelagius TaxID=28169 RepID=A0ABY5G698_VIBPE|nr:tetratricopeptide repeat protein [Vibrio pelagius]UTT85705.1 tetratricopeptide repeat protein [Vibrio pelagius]